MNEDEDMNMFTDKDFLDVEDDTNETNENEEIDVDEESENEDNDDKDSSEDEDIDSNDEEDSEDESTEEEDDKQDDSKQSTPKTLKVRVNHQDLEVAEEEAIKWIQKGMDYDRVKDQVNTYKNDPRLTFVESLAKQHNMTVDQYIDAVSNKQYQDMLDELLEQGVTEALAKEIVGIRREKDQESKAKSQQQKQTDEERDLIDFVDYYQKLNGKPFDPDSENLPESVWQANAAGTPLKQAYMEFLVEQKQEVKKQEDKKQKQEEKKKEVKAKAPVKGVTNNGSGKSPKKDPVFDGLFED